MKKKRGQALVGDGRVGREVRSEAHPNGGVAQHCFQKQPEELDVVVGR
jgi:hypothetical protein